MTDVLTEEERRLVMSRIGPRDTKPEMEVRRGLHALGLRFRLQDGRLPGRPDLVFRAPRVAVFVHGCFWHAHGCHLSKQPQTRKEFWRAKLGANIARDAKAVAALQAEGWRVLIVWECAMRGSTRLALDDMLGRAAAFIREGPEPVARASGQSAAVSDVTGVNCTALYGSVRLSRSAPMHWQLIGGARSMVDNSRGF